MGKSTFSQCKCLLSLQESHPGAPRCCKKPARPTAPDTAGEAVIEFAHHKTINISSEMAANIRFALLPSLELRKDLHLAFASTLAKTNPSNGS